MKLLESKQFAIIAIVCVAAAIISGLMFFALPQKKPVVVKTNAPEQQAVTPKTDIPVQAKPKIETLGLSVQGRKIESYSFGEGKTPLVFVGGIHGGYEWNSSLLEYQIIDYLNKNPAAISKNLSVTIIPSLNPDGLFKVTGKTGRFSASDIPANQSNEAGRLNADGVDLNRNFGCNWKATGTWRGTEVSGGTAAFSEPESAAFKKFIIALKPAAVIFWHSQSNTIYGSQCGGNMLAETAKIMEIYSKASGYPTAETFDGYQVTGDVTDWLASVGIPAMSVELSTHQSTEWEKNLAGIRALLEYYSEKQ